MRPWARVAVCPQLVRLLFRWAAPQGAQGAAAALCPRERSLSNLSAVQSSFESSGTPRRLHPRFRPVGKLEGQPRLAQQCRASHRAEWVPTNYTLRKSVTLRIPRQTGSVYDIIEPCDCPRMQVASSRHPTSGAPCSDFTCPDADAHMQLRAASSFRQSDCR